MGKNPIKYIDPDGKAAFLFTISQGDNLFESFGHSAVYVQNDQGEGEGVSLGGNHDFANGPVEFVNSYLDEGRHVLVTLIDSNDAQDNAMIDFLRDPAKGANGAGTDRSAPGADFMIRENCAKAACNVLNSGGLLERNASDQFGGLISTPTKLLQSVTDSDFHVGTIKFSPERRPDRNFLDLLFNVQQE